MPKYKTMIKHNKQATMPNSTIDKGISADLITASEVGQAVLKDA